MHSEPLSLLVDGVRIPGVFTTPGNPIASLLLIPGSMNSDVDGNYAPMYPGQPASRPHAYKDLAEHLAAENVAVLRYAKSGPGTGTEVVDPQAAGDKFKQFPQRVCVAAAFLAELRRRAPGLPCLIAGHSEGSVVATLLAPSHPDLAGVVLLSGPSQPLLRLMMRQQYEAAGRKHHDQYAAAVALLDDYVAGRPLPEDLQSNPYASMLAFASLPENVTYLRSLEAIDPAAELATVRQPVLIIQGGRDTSVSPDNADALQRANPDACIVRFPELQHFYKHVLEGLSPQESFAIDSASDPAVSRAIAQWVGQAVPPVQASEARP